MEGKGKGMNEESDSPTLLHVRRQGQKMTAEERTEVQANFLGRFAEDGNVTEACKAANIDRSTIYAWREKYKTFAELFAEAEAQVHDRIRAEIFHRALVGDEEVVVSMGKIMRGDDGKPLIAHKKSDQLLMFLAKAKMPEFREKQQVEHSAKDDKPIVFTTIWGGGVLEDEDEENA